MPSRCIKYLKFDSFVPNPCAYFVIEGVLSFNKRSPDSSLD